MTTGEWFSYVDAGDTLTILASLTSDGALSVLLHRAADLLGASVRDAGLLHRLLDELPAHESFFRRGAALALGAIGNPPDPAAVLRSPHDRLGFDAYALSLGVAPMSPKERATRLGALAGELAPSLRGWAQEVGERALSGDTITLSM